MKKDKNNKIDNEVIAIDNDEVTVVDNNSDLNFDIDLKSPRASSGTITKNFHNDGYYLRISWKITSQSKSNNTSTVEVSAILGSNGSSYYISSSANKNISLTINGTKYSGSTTVGISANKSKTLMTKTVTVGHNSDGSKTCNFSCTLGIAVTLSGKWYESVSASGTGTFDKINLNSAPKIGSISAPAKATIAENVTSQIVTWSAASDADGNLSGYQIYRYVNGSLQFNDWIGNVTSWTDSSLGSWGQGATIQYGIKAKDAGGLWSGEAKSGVLTKNKLTAATVTSTSTIDNDTESIKLSWSGASNTYNNSTFKYDITCNNSVTVYNATNLTGSSATIKILASGTDTGPYVLKKDIINAFKSSSYKGTLTFTLKTKNNYSSSGTSTKGISVDLRTTPTAAKPTINTSSTSTAYKTANGSKYWIPDGSSIMRVTWSKGTDPLESALSYKVTYKIGSGSTVTAVSSTTSTSCDIVLPKQTSSQTVTITVTTTTAYSYSSTASTTATLHYYNPPSIEVGTISRSDTEASVLVKTALNTSISGIGWSTRTYKLNTASSATNLTSNSQTIKATGLSGSKTYTWTITAKDNSGLHTTNVTKTITIPINVPIFSIREKGVGVNCVPASDGTNVFQVSGNAKIPTINGNTTINGLGTLRDGLKVVAPDGSYSKTVLKPYTANENGLNLTIDSGAAMILGSGESATNYLTSVIPNNTVENLYLVSDQTITLASNCQDMPARKEITISDGLMTVNTGGTSASTGIHIQGSSGKGVLWAGSAGFAIQSIGDFNLHLGRNGSTSDMVFYSDKLQIKKVTDITGNTSITGTFKATGTSTLAAVNATNIAASGTLKATGATTLSSTLAVTGKATLNADSECKGSFTVGGNVNSAWSMNIGVYEEKFRSVNCKRMISATSSTTGKAINYEARWGVSHRDVALSSDHAKATTYGGVIESYNGSTEAVARSFLFGSTGFFPTGDNNSYLGASTHRWQAAYCTTGKFYTSTKSYKTNIKSVDSPLQELTVFSTDENKRNIKTPKEYILEAIKDTPMTVYNYKSRMHNDARSTNIADNPMFIGFIADELKEKHPEFFELIGESGIHQKDILDENCEPTGETYEEMQYDISDISMLGALWTGLQEALIQIDNLKEEVNKLKGENENV